MISRIILFISIVLSPAIAFCQELNCQVTIDHSQVQTSNTELFRTLEEAISDYLNTRKWTNTQFSPNEKIDCKIFITIKSYDDPQMSGDLQIQASRPVYNSSYTTTVLNFKDTKISFEYSQGEPLNFSETTMESNLTAILNFYAYLVLAVDFDTFSPRGGDVYFDQLRNIVQMAQSSGETGWKAYDDNKNRSAVLNSFTEPATQQIRDLYYQYHRTGLDEMSVSHDKGRSHITEALEILKKVHSSQPMSVGLSMFKDAKIDELVNIYSKGTQEERDKVYDLLYTIYPAENKRLDLIKKPQTNNR